MVVDYRHDPFTDAPQSVQKNNELHIIPANSPYTIRLSEVPKKDAPSSITLRIRDKLAAAITTTGATTCTVAHGAWFANGDVITIDSEQMQVTGIAGNVMTVTRGYNSTVATTHLINAVVYGPVLSEVSATPAARQYWPDYTTGADGDDTWNTGTVLFNSAQAGVTVAVSYKGTGTLVDARALGGKTVYDTPGTYTFVAPTDKLKVTVIGAGGSGGGVGTSSGQFYAGAAGGASSFGPYLSASGGGGAQVDAGSPTAGIGAYPAVSTTSFHSNPVGYFYGSSIRGGTGANEGAIGGYGYGSGGGGAKHASVGQHADGGCGDAKTAMLTVTPGEPITVTVGAGCVSATGTYKGGTGAPGAVIVEW